MAEIVRYESLADAASALLKDADALDDPVTSFLSEIETQIGTDGKAWSGTAAEEVVPLLKRLQVDIEKIQTACNAYGDKVGVSKANYQTADAKAVGDIYNKIG